MKDLLNPKVTGIDLLKQNQYNPDNPADGPTSLAFKNHIARVVKALSSNGIETIPLHTSLAARNNGPVGTGRIMNPAFPLGAPPASVGIYTAFADVPPGSPGIPFFDEKKDFHKQKSLEMAKKFLSLNLYNQENTATDNVYESSKTERVDGVDVEVYDPSKVFNEQRVGFDFGNGNKGYQGFKPKSENRLRKTEDRIRKEKSIENADVFFHPDELEKGYIEEVNFDKEGFTDATNYLPFYMEDLRQPPSLRRRIYFRAFLKGFRESISPNWSQENFFGRVDPVGTYTGTSRTVSVQFAIAAMSPQGFSVMWKKMNQLAKLFYPTYRNGVIIKSPMARLRIGDVICDETGEGLPGYFSSPLELDYSDSPWEIEQWTGSSLTNEKGKAPQIIICSLGFQVIHETNPKLDEIGSFDTTFFRRIGKLKEIQDTPTDIEEGGLDLVGD